jgi:hypothetical protein
MLDIARQRYAEKPKLDFGIGEVEKLPFPSIASWRPMFPSTSTARMRYYRAPCRCVTNIFSKHRS